ncbi:MAG: TetR/AcrR family transcriptional regulator [Lactimicrobium sp.]|uniref:TetR/AcrR family transcriptional regulator n=1 Tax=Lactimicrobium sp. TaxID=2563780 RepID=UPI002F3516CA
MKDTRANIVRTTMELFQKKGYENTTIASICKACHITKGTFYYYFNSKDDICGAYYDMVQDEVDSIMPELLMMGDPREQLWKVMEYGITTSMRLGPRLMKAFFVSEMQTGLQQFSVYKMRIPAKDKDRDIRVLERTLIQKGQAAGRIRHGDPDKMIYTFHSACMAMAFDWASHDGSFDEKEEMKTYFEAIF